MEPKLIYDETWLSNKQYNTRVKAQPKKNSEISTKPKSPRTSTYQVSNGQVIHERIYPGNLKNKLCLRVAVNGASKSMRGELPLSNLNLTNGDFGDDAGMFVDNREYCFVGKYIGQKQDIRNNVFFSLRFSRWCWWKSFSWYQSSRFLSSYSCFLSKYSSTK